MIKKLLFIVGLALIGQTNGGVQRIREADGLLINKFEDGQATCYVVRTIRMYDNISVACIKR